MKSTTTGHKRILWYSGLRRFFGFRLMHITRRSIALEREPPDRYSARLASAEDLQPFCNREPYDLDYDFVCEAFDRGDACTTLWDGERLVAYGFRAYGPAPHVDGIWVRFGPGQRYSYKAFTHPDYRGQRLRGSFGLLAERDAAQAVDHLINFVDITNEASIRGTRHAGSEFVGYAGYFRLFGRHWFFRTPGAARYGFSFYENP